MHKKQTRYSLSESKALFERANYGLRGNTHCEQSIAERVIVGAGWRNLVDRYINCDIGICLHVHAMRVPIDLEGCNMAFVFQKSATDDSHIRKTATFGESNLRIGIEPPRTNDVQSPMPVLSRPVVQNSESPIEIKGHQLRFEFGSVIRLYRLDKVPQVIREWRDVPSGIIEAFRGTTDGKCKVLFIGGRILSSLKNGSIIDTAIKSGPQLIEQFAKFERENSGKCGVVWPHPDATCPIVLHAHGETVGIIIDKAVPCFGEGFAVSVCPFDSLPTALGMVALSNFGSLWIVRQVSCCPNLACL